MSYYALFNVIEPVYRLRFNKVFAVFTWIHSLITWPPSKLPLRVRGFACLEVHIDRRVSIPGTIFLCIVSAIGIESLLVLLLVIVEPIEFVRRLRDLNINISTATLFVVESTRSYSSSAVKSVLEQRTMGVVVTLSVAQSMGREWNSPAKNARKEQYQFADKHDFLANDQQEADEQWQHQRQIKFEAQEEGQQEGLCQRTT